MGTEIQKNQKMFATEKVFFGEGPFYPVLVQSDREEGGGGRHVLGVASVGARGGGGTCRAAVRYTYTH